MSTAPFTPAPNPDPSRLILDPEAVAFVLYLSPFRVVDWYEAGPSFWVGYFLTTTADPASPVVDVVTRLIAADQAGQLNTGTYRRMTAARLYADYVVAAFAN